MKCKICEGKTEVWYKKLFDDRHGYLGYFDVEKCVKCGFAQTQPQIPKNKIQKIYSKYYPRQNLDLRNINRKNYKMENIIRLWLKGIRHGCEYWVKPRSKVLDVGSGLGYSLLRLENIGCKVYGIDPDINAQKVAKRFCLNFHLGFIEDNPFPKEKFDYVLASQVIEHTNNPIKYLKLCKKRLKKNGVIILSFPNTESLGRKIFRSSWLHWHLPYHLNHFNKNSVYKLAEKADLEINKIITITPNLWTNLQIKRLLYKPEMGKRDTSWDPAPKKISQKSNIKYLKLLLHFLEKYNLINRIIDFLGYGESFVVFMSVKK
jgi:2-polyprenyl-3-methyl-5-hydroxy-6-metoxy-1,4-benzoquinol methylase